MEPMVVMAARAAQKVGQEILNAHNNRHKLEFTIESKGLDGLVTQIDRYSEELLIAMLKESYPTHSFLGEEFGLQEGKGNDKDWCWVIDPLDGTHNFIHGLPHFCVSIGVQKMASPNMVSSMTQCVMRCFQPVVVKVRASTNAVSASVNIKPLMAAFLPQVIRLSVTARKVKYRMPKSILKAYKNLRTRRSSAPCGFGRVGFGICSSGTV